MPKFVSAAAAKVWNRTGEAHALSRNAFVLLITAWTAAGIGVSAVMAYLAADWRPNPLSFLGLAVVPFIAIFAFGRRRHPLLSLLCYALIAVPFGLILGPVVAMYTKASVFKVLTMTTGMTLTLGVVGALWPRSLEHWAGWLFGALLGLIVGYLAVFIVAATGGPALEILHWLDWIAVALFSLLVVYDLNRAMRLERTHANAIDSAVSLYLDFLNLFQHLLSIFGIKTDD